MSEVLVTGAVTATISRMHACSGTTADYTVTLPPVSGNDGKSIGFRMVPGLTKLVTIDGNASETIDGALSRVMWAGETAILYCDGSNWFKIAGRSIPMQCTMFLSAVQQPVAHVTTTKVNLDTSYSDNTGLMADTTNKRIVIKRTSNYIVSAITVHCDTAGAAIAAAGPRFLTQQYYDGAQLNAGETNGVTLGYPTPPCVTLAALVTSKVLELYGHQQSGVNEGFHGTAAITGGPCQMAVVESPTW